MYTPPNPWVNWESYPQPQALRSADLSNDDAFACDLKLNRSSREDNDARLFTPRDKPFSMDIVDYRQDGLSTDEPKCQTVTKRDEFEEKFRSPFEGYDSRFIILKPAYPNAVSSSELHLPEEIARKTLTTYQVMAPFLECLHQFGERETEHAEDQFSGALHRLKLTGGESLAAKSLPTGDLSGFESTYNFHFLYRKNKTSSLDIDNWRIRKTGVYHQFSYKDRKNVWILVQPESRVQDRINQSLKAQAASCSDSKSPLEMHLLFMSAAMADWRTYFHHLEAYFMEETSPAVNKMVGTSDKDADPKTIADGGNLLSPDLRVSFSNVQRLQKFEELVQSFKACLQSNEDVLNMLQDLNTSLREFSLDRESLFSWKHVDSTLRHHVRCTQAYIRGSEKLLLRVQGRARLLYNVLDYQHKETLNNQTTQQIEASSNMERKNELQRATTLKITQAAMHETVGVRIMTIMALFYLPQTFVTSIIQAGMFTYESDKKPTSIRFIPHIFLSPELIGLYCFLTTPITLLTIAAWKLWEYWEAKKVERVAGLSTKSTIASQP